MASKGFSLRKGQKMRSLRKVTLAIVLFLVVMAVPACDLLPESKGPTIEVLSPGDFATVQLGENVDVVSTATDAKGVTRVELYVGEDLYRTDGSPTPEGETAWTLTQTWMTTAPGHYTLTVVAYNVDGVGSTPWAVAVEVVEGSTTGGTPASRIPPATTTPPPGATGTPPSTGTVAPPSPATSTVAAPPPTGTPPPPAPTNTPVSPTPTNTPPPMADLYIAELSIDPEQPRVGQEAQSRVVVRNGGNAPSGVFGLAVLNAPPGPNMQLQVQADHDPLAPGDARVFALPLTFYEPGLATMWAHIAVGVQDPDSDGDNNTAELVVNVLPGDLPDLYIASVHLDPSSPQVGQEVQVSISLVNGGSGNAGPFTVTWKSDPDTIGCSWDVPGLAAGQTAGRTCTYTYTYPHSGQSTYTTADADGDVHESNEDNNVRYLRVNVRPAS
jgi:hypothetical protein